jgi:hypothetical protein
MGTAACRMNEANNLGRRCSRSNSSPKAARNSAVSSGAKFATCPYFV